MKAVVCRTYGPSDFLSIEEIPTPDIADHQVLIRVQAASVNPLDWHFMRGTPYLIRMGIGLRKPRTARLGVDVAGRIEAVGGKVTRFHQGDEVFGAGAGAFAEYVSAAEKDLVLKPQSVAFEQAATLNIAGLTALQALRDRGQLRPGHKVLINGAAGGVGTFAVQIARWLGADVTGVCSTRNVPMVQSIGALRVIDYTRENFTTTGQRYDLILDMIGNHSLADRRRALTPKGTLVLVGAPDKGVWLGPLADLLNAFILSPFVGQKLLPFMTRSSQADLTILQELVLTGTVTPVIDRTYLLREVPQAITYVEEGHARGKVVITVA